MPNSMPSEGIMANLVLFAAVVGINVLGWKETLALPSPTSRSPPA